MKTKDQHRYFIELQLGAEADVPRNREAEVRRAQAAQFIDQMALWLEEQELHDKVASMAITALGQVQITCDMDIISRLRGDENLNIATIRHGSTWAESMNRIGAR